MSSGNTDSRKSTNRNQRWVAHRYNVGACWAPWDLRARSDASRVRNPTKERGRWKTRAVSTLLAKQRRCALPLPPPNCVTKHTLYGQATQEGSFSILHGKLAPIVWAKQISCYSNENATCLKQPSAEPPDWTPCFNRTKTMTNFI